jgi:hypothetical protein
MIRIAAVLVLLMPGGTVERSGWAPHYRPGLIERVARNRGLRESACMVAAYDWPIGAWVRVTSRRNGRSERCQVVDVCAPKDCRRLRGLGYIAELGWPAAKRLCGHKRYADRGPRTCPVRVVG